MGASLYDRRIPVIANLAANRPSGGRWSVCPGPADDQLGVFRTYR
jgi:hypothetical protein